MVLRLLGGFWRVFCVLLSYVSDRPGDVSDQPEIPDRPGKRFPVKGMMQCLDQPNIADRPDVADRASAIRKTGRESLEKDISKNKGSEAPTGFLTCFLCSSFSLYFLGPIPDARCLEWELQSPPIGLSRVLLKIQNTKASLSTKREVVDEI